jgi:hypothetical protein
MKAPKNGAADFGILSEALPTIPNLEPVLCYFLCTRTPRTKGSGFIDVNSWGLVWSCTTVEKTICTVCLRVQRMRRLLSSGSKKIKDNVGKLFDHGSTYAASRPVYPQHLADNLARISPSTNLAWDAGTGNGQLASLLGNKFEKVVASDINDKMIGSAKPHLNVKYVVLPAEATDEEYATAGLLPGSVDLITVAQALHWFNFDAWHATVNKFLKPGGIYAGITYDLPIISEDIDPLVRYYYKDVVGKYWDINRKWVEDRYTTIPLGEMSKFEVKDINSLLDEESQFMQMEWNFQQLIGYIDSWSSTQTAVKKLGKHPLKDDPVLMKKFQDAWKLPFDQKIKCRYPLFFRIAKKA